MAPHNPTQLADNRRLHNSQTAQEYDRLATAVPSGQSRQTSGAFLITLSNPTGSTGGPDGPCTLTYDVAHGITGAPLGTAVNPAAAPHIYRRSPKGVLVAGNGGLACWKGKTLVIVLINEVPNTNPCGTT